MRIYNQFFDNETLKNLLKYAKEARYTRVEDGKYNFKKASVEGVLFSETQKTFYKNNIEGNLESLRVQCIDDSINVAESFHTHNTVYTTNLVCFLNDDFSGGEFEYIEDTTKLIILL